MFVSAGDYAVVLKEVDHPVGSIGLMLGKASNIGIPDTEGEIGYWIGVLLGTGTDSGGCSRNNEIRLQ